MTASDKYYVIVNRYSGKLLTGTESHWHIETLITRPVWRFPNEKRPLLFMTKEIARKRIETLLLRKKNVYIRVAKERELKIDD